MHSKHYVVVALIVGLSIAVTARAESVGDRLRKGIYQEETVGDLAAAMKIYQQIVADEKTNRPHVAQAKFRLGMCFLKKGQKQQAVETLEKLIAEFPDQSKMIEQARGLLTVLGSEASSEEPGVQLQDVWAYSGLGELDVLTISRDGRYCAFVDGTGGMMVRDLKNEFDQRIAETAPKGGESANWQRASISPDNKWVAYVGRIPDPAPRSCVQIVQLDGSHPHVLYANEEKSVIRDLEWSPDSQHLLVSMVDTRGQQDVFNTVPIRIATVSLTDGTLRLLKTLAPEQSYGPGPKPQYSPDGRYVAFAKVMDEASRQEDVFLIPLDGGPEIHLVEHSADDDVLGWMPDGQGLVFRSDRRGNGYDAYVVRLINGKPVEAPQLLATGIGPDLEGPVRTPTGGWAFYYSDVYGSQHTDVMIADFDPEEGQIIGDPKPASNRFPGDTYRIPGWSPDGEFLAYHADSRQEAWPRNPAVIVIRSTQTGRERIIKLGVNRIPGPVSWSPDGRSILLSSEWNSFGPVQRLDVDSGLITPVGPLSSGGEIGSAQQPIGWSADGKTVFFFSNRLELRKGYRKGYRGKILMHNLETGHEAVLHHDKNTGIFACVLSPDRTQIAYPVPAYDERTLMLMPTSAGEPRELFSVPDTERILQSVTWSLDGRYLLFWRVTVPDPAGPATYSLWRMPVKGGEPEKLAWETQSKIIGLRLHPSGKQVAFDTESRITKNHIRMLQLSPEWAKESCIANLQVIGEALQRYEHDHGAMPEHLSGLYPDYLQDANLLLCPAHDDGQVQRIQYDPEMQSSYEYAPGTYHATLPVILPDEELTKSKTLELRTKYLGGRAGLVTCREHDPRLHLHLTIDGRIHESSWWGGDGRADKGLLSQLQAAMESNPETWLEDYDIPKLVFMLEDRPALTEMLRVYIDAHPANASASAQQALDEAERVRFVNRSEDDANELSDGQIELQARFCTLGGVERLGNRAVGFRFTDIPVCQGAHIKRAYVRFESIGYGPSWGNEGLTFHGELTGNAESFQNVENNISSRPKTVASVKCSPEIWYSETAEGRTSNLAEVVQEITAQPDWREGNALVLIVSGSSKGEATPWDWSRGRGAAMLYVEVE